MDLDLEPGLVTAGRIDSAWTAAARFAAAMSRPSSITSSGQSVTMAGVRGVVEPLVDLHPSSANGDDRDPFVGKTGHLQHSHDNANVGAHVVATDFTAPLDTDDAEVGFDLALQVLGECQIARLEELEWNQLAGKHRMFEGEHRQLIGDHPAGATGPKSSRSGP